MTTTRDDARTTGTNDGAPDGGTAGNGRGPSLPVARDVPALRLVATLAIAGALAGGLIVGVFEWAQPRILEHQARVLGAAVEEVLQGPARYETLWLVEGELTAALPAGRDSLAFERVWRGYDADGRVVGYAIAGGEPGFQDVIRLIFGWDPATDRLLGMKVLENKETPGLGDKIVKDTLFTGEFPGAGTPLVGVKKGAGTGTSEEVDMITGATISSRAVIAIINHRIEALGPAIRRHNGEAAQ